MVKAYTKKLDADSTDFAEQQISMLSLAVKIATDSARLLMVKAYTKKLDADSTDSAEQQILSSA